MPRINKLLPKLKGLKLEQNTERLWQIIEAQQEQNHTNLSAVPQDISDFANLILIRSGRQIVPFTLYPHQEIMLDLIEKHRFFVGIKSRQMGATQAVILRFLHKASLNPAYAALVFSKSQQDTSLIAYRCREMIKSLEGIIEPATDSLQTIRIKGGGAIYFRNSKVDGARGIDSVSDILYDEAGFVPEMEEIYKATDPTQAMVGDDARTIVLSTPNGQAGWYFDQANGNNPDEWDLLETIKRVRQQELPPVVHWVDNDGWVKYIAYWRAHPLYGANENYLEDLARKRKLPASVIAQEYDLSFEDAAERIFTPALVKQCCSGEFSDEIKTAPNIQYYFGIDTALQGLDYFVCLVTEFDTETRVARVVKWYRNRTATLEYNILRVSELIDLYRPKTVAIETNSAGQVYLEELIKLHEDIYFKPLVTSQTSKNANIHRLMLFMERMLIVFPNNREIKQEFLSFERKGKQLQAISGKHDDIVLSASFVTRALPDPESSHLDMNLIKRVQRRA